MVRMGRAPHKRALERDTPQDRQTAARALAAVGMAGFETRSFSSLSGGEQQRVILARALVQQTPCLILDEPTNHLDIQYQLGMMDLVRGLGKTVLAALHDLNIAAAYCDWLYALQDGRLVGSGPPRALLTPAFIRRVYKVEARALEIDGQRMVLDRTKHTQEIKAPLLSHKEKRGCFVFGFSRSAEIGGWRLRRRLRCCGLSWCGRLPGLPPVRCP